MYGNTGTFSIQSAWDCWRLRQPQVGWESLIWFPGHVAGYSTIVWLAIKGKLSTSDRLVRFGLRDDS